MPKKPNIVYRKDGDSSNLEGREINRVIAKNSSPPAGREKGVCDPEKVHFMFWVIFQPASMVVWWLVA